MKDHLQKIGEGVYVKNNGQIEFDIPELLAYLGFEDTPANRDLATAMAIKAVSEVFPQVKEKIVTTSNPEATGRSLSDHRKYKHCCLGNN